MKDRSSSGPVGKVVGVVFGGLFATVWILGWSAATLTFDVVWTRAVLAQRRAVSYPTTQGTVLGSHVRESDDSEGGTSYSPKVRYGYEVGGRRYECDVYRHGMSGSGRRRANAMVAAHPVGRAVTVYYNPADPSDAVLRPGLVAGDFFMPLFMTPFNLVMVVSWLVVGAVLGRPLIKPSPAGVRIRHDGMILRLRPEAFPPVAAAAIAAGLATIPCIFIAGFAGGPDAAPAFIYASWGFVLTVALLAYFRTARPQWAGHIDLVIDPWRKTMTLPRTHGRREAVDVAFADVTAVDVEHRQNTDSEGTVTHDYLPTLRWKDRERVERSGILAKWGDSERAERFAAWLRERIGLKQQPARATAEAPASAAGPTGRAGT